ncbi:MAG TPA: exodeoxyribonuclease VII large subunit [Acidimicrobiia bacterium]|nr:exodeoxyribonuclease VII large subunit [Acidimicrobiia bacterium]
MTEVSLTVSQVLTRLREVVVGGFPSPVWIRGEVTGLRRTNRGAGFLRLADTETPGASLEAMARGVVMGDIDRILGESGLGSLRDGVEVRLRGTIDVDQRGSVVRLNILEVDPSFTAGKLALDRAEVIRRMTSDGSMRANRVLPIPLVPLRVGLVTSRGSAAHGDFTDQLRRAPYRFTVMTAHTRVQGDEAPDEIAAALKAMIALDVDVVAMVRGGGSKLDLAAFDTEVVARAVSAMPIPVVTGIGHEMDRSVSDEAAAVAQKTPSAAGEWLVARVKDFADRVDVARHTIRSEASSALRRQRQLVRTAASDISRSKETLRRQQDHLSRLRSDIAHASRQVLDRQRDQVRGLDEWFSAVDVDSTLRRGFAIVTRDDGSLVIRSVGQVAGGDRLRVRLADGTVTVTVVDE